MTQVGLFTWIDYAIFAAYLIASVSVGLLFIKEQRTIKDYFLAGRSMNSILVGVSVLAALTSGISYLGGPGEVYAHGTGMAWYALSFFIATPITTLIFVPFFYQARFYTAYQYLEERFSVQVRVLSSSLFIVRVLLWLALVAYAPALALEQVTGLPLWLTIVCTGVLTTFYTTLGGMKAVIWTDTLQFVVLFGGLIVILAVALVQVPGGMTGAFEIGRAAGKLDVSFSLDPSIRITFAGLLVGSMFTNLVQLATDQVAVQRYLTASSLREAKRALWIKLALLLPVIAVVYSTGLVIFAFYHAQGEDPLAAGKISSPDQILPYFVVHELPVGLPGLLIAAIFAATMSATSSGLNALASATTVDFYQRLARAPRQGDEEQLRLARRLTIAYGALVIVLALVVHRLGTLAEASIKAVGLVGGPLLGMFLLGMLSRRVSATGAVIGWFAGVLALIPVAFGTGISFLWYAMIGCLATMTVGWMASFIWGQPQSSELDKLVVRRSPGGAQHLG